MTRTIQPDIRYLAELAQAAMCDLLAPIRSKSGIGAIRQVGNTECGVHMLVVTLSIADSLTENDWAAIIAHVEYQPQHVYTERSPGTITFGLRSDDSEDPLAVLHEQARLIGLTLYRTDVLPCELMPLYAS